MTWMNPFKNPYHGAQFSAPGSARVRCKKCDGGATGMRYDKSLDVLRYRCHDCGYEWQGPPADRAASDPIRLYDEAKQAASKE